MPAPIPAVFLLPDLGEGLRDAEIVAWHVAEGDHVVADQPLVSVETDKAVVEIPSPHAGRIAQLLAPLHARVEIGAPLVAFAEGVERDTGTVVGELTAAPGDSGTPSPVVPGEGTAHPVMAGEGRPSTTSPGAGVTERRGWPAPSAAIQSAGESWPGLTRPSTRGDREVQAPIRPDRSRVDGRVKPGHDTEGHDTGGHDTGGGGASVGHGRGARATPAVRALAASLGVDLTALSGTGPDGEITRADVQRAASPEPGTEALTGTRRAMAQRMAEAGTSVVPATVTDEVDVDSWAPGSNVTTRLVAALVAGCHAEPALNARFDPAAMTRTLQSAVHVGLAVDTRDGLFVPVLRNAQDRDATALAAELEHLETAVRTRQIAPDALRGATISLSNFGTLGGRFAALVVVPPQVAILGAGRIARRPVADGTNIVLHRILPLSLTFDHRVVTGGEAARFLAAVKAQLEAAPQPSGDP